MKLSDAFRIGPLPKALPSSQRASGRAAASSIVSTTRRRRGTPRRRRQKTGSDLGLPLWPRDAAETTEVPRPRQGVRRTQKLVDNSQTTKELAASKGRKGKGPTKRKLGEKAAAAAAE